MEEGGGRGNTGAFLPLYSSSSLFTFDLSLFLLLLSSWCSFCWGGFSWGSLGGWGRCWGGLVNDWSWLVNDWSWLVNHRGWSWLVWSWSWGWWVGSLAFVSDLGLVAAVAVDGVGDLLDPAVGKVDEVGSGGGAVVARLGLAEVVAGVVVLNGVLVGVDGWHHGVGWRRSVSSWWWRVWSGHGVSGDGGQGNGGNEGLHDELRRERRN